MKQRICKVVFYRENDGRVIASIPGVPGCLAYGRTISAAERRVRAILKFALQQYAREGLPIPKVR